MTVSKPFQNSKQAKAPIGPDQYFLKNTCYLITYLMGLLFLVAFYTLDYSVDMESGKVRSRDNIVSKNELRLLEAINHTWIGNKFYKKYSTKREREIVFSRPQDGSEIQINNIFSEEYPKLSVHDWGKEIAYSKIIKDSLSSNQLPFHVENFSIIFKANTDRFIGAPIWPFSPQIVLLYVLSPMAFIFINHLFLYTIGTYGIIKLSDEHGLKYPAFFLVFSIFNFNGHIIEKFSAYGPSQMGYYFVPYVLLFFLRLIKSEANSSDSIKFYINSIYLGIAFALILQQVAFHLYVQFVTFVIIWAFFNLSKLKYIAVSLMVAFAINAARFLPAVVVFGASPNKRNVGYTDPVMIFKSILYPTTQFTWPPFAWWEASAYISVFGFLILVKYSLIDPLVKGKNGDDQFDRRIYFPIIIMIMMAMWKVSHYLIPDFIPLLNSESYPHRYLIVPLLFLTVIASFNLNRHLDSMSLWKKIFLYLLLGMMLISLLDHLLQWRLLKIQTEVNWLLLNTDTLVEGHGLEGLVTAGNILLPSLKINNRHDDFFYVLSFYSGLIISLISVFFTVLLLKKLQAVAVRLNK